MASWLFHWANIFGWIYIDVYGFMVDASWVRCGYKPSYDWKAIPVGKQENPSKIQAENLPVHYKEVQQSCKMQVASDHQSGNSSFLKGKSWPIGSMYGIYANIGGILMVNVTIYGIRLDPMGE